MIHDLNGIKISVTAVFHNPSNDDIIHMNKNSVGKARLSVTWLDEMRKTELSMK